MQGNKSLNDYFENIYCLNMDSRPDRWNNVSERFKQLNIRAERFSAYNSNSDIVNQKFKDLKSLPGSRISKLSEMGCAVSHYKILEDAISKGYESILVLEDDVMIHKEINSRIQILDKIKDWDAISLGCSEYRIKIFGQDIIDRGYYTPTFASYGTFAYAVRKNSFKDLYYEYEKLRDPADLHLLNFYKSKKSYVLYPNLIIANVEDSDIRGPLNQRVEAIRRNWVLSDYI